MIFVPGYHERGGLSTSSNAVRHGSSHNSKAEDFFINCPTSLNPDLETNVLEGDINAEFTLSRSTIPFEFPAGQNSILPKSTLANVSKDPNKVPNSRVNSLELILSLLSCRKLTLICGNMTTKILETNQWALIPPRINF